jgi:Tfp pilus assembly protein PilF
MTRYARKPAAAVLVLSFGAGLGVLAATGQFRAGGVGGDAIDVLERAIASGKNDWQTWAGYGAALQQTHRYVHAAAAYGRALELQPDVEALSKLRFNEGVCLAQAGDADKFFAFFTHLTAADPKAAVDLLERAEVSGMRGDARWAGAAATARAQAAD